MRFSEEEKCGRDWTVPDEETIFEDVRVRMGGEHDSYTRRVIIGPQKDPECSPGMVMVPGVRVNIGRMRNRTLVTLLGT